MTAIPEDRQVPAPGLRETADIWWDTGHDPVVVWDPSGTRFHLADPGGGRPWLELLDLRPAAASAAGGSPPAGPGAEEIARTLAAGLAACDFPPTGSGVPPGRARATLAARGLTLSST